MITNLLEAPIDSPSVVDSHMANYHRLNDFLYGADGLYETLQEAVQLYSWLPDPYGVHSAEFSLPDTPDVLTISLAPGGGLSLVRDRNPSGHLPTLRCYTLVLSQFGTQECQLKFLPGWKKSKNLDDVSVRPRQILTDNLLNSFKHGLDQVVLPDLKQAGWLRQAQTARGS